MRTAGTDFPKVKLLILYSPKYLIMKYYNSLNVAFALLLGMSSSASAQQKNTEVPIPKQITIEKGLSPALAEAEKQATLNFYAFWNSGKRAYMDKSVSAVFFDNTLPSGRPQGINGLIFAQDRIRKAIPDLRCILEDVIISGDKVTARMVFTGTHKGMFMGQKGTGKKIEFIAIDILRIKDGKVIEDWHIEDNLSFLRQMGALK